MLKNERVWQFLDGLSDSTPTPGGGSASALSGAMGAALVSMVARLTIESDKYAAVRKEMKRILVASERMRISLMASIDLDSKAYEGVIAAYRMPKETDAQKKTRSKAIQKALKKATDIPFDVANKSLIVLELAVEMSEKGYESAISDIGVAALLADTAVKGAIYNVKINTGSLNDQELATKINEDVAELLDVTEKLSGKVWKKINEKLTKK
jgi:formiminotetrahydrofolate cyclodeaminase